jgi:hypothetical protein
MDDNMTPEECQRKLEEYSKAVREEFALQQEAREKEKAGLDTLTVHEFTQDFFKKNIAHAAAQIYHLAMHAESETVRLKAATTIIEKALQDAVAQGDPIKNLLQEITAKSKDPANTRGIPGHQPFPLDAPE